MKKSLLLSVLLMPIFTCASIHVNFDLQVDDERITQDFELSDQNDVALFDSQDFLLEFSATPEEELAKIVFHIYRKTEHGPELTCSPEINVAWGEEATLEYVTDDDDKHCVLKVMVTRD